MASSVVSIPDQPLIFSAPPTDDCNCGERNQCLLVEPLQDIYAQFKLQPCGTVNVCNNTLGNELVCNGGFDLGNELVTNGTFDGSATGWTLGTNWAYGTDNACATSAGGGETLSQTIAITNGKLYRVSFEVENHAGDGGDIRPELGGTNGGSVTANGTYEQFIIAGAGTDIVFNNVGIDFTGCITNVSVRLLDCWTFGTPWTWSNGLACITAGNFDVLSQTINPNNGSKYLVTFDVSNYTTGGVIVSLGGTSAPPVTADGTYSIMIVSGAGTDIEFTASSFTGCIDNVSVMEIIPCWDADETDWITSVDGACHVPGNTTDLTNTGTTLTVGLYYHFTFTVSGSTAGGVTLKADTAAIGAQTSGNGTFERWGTADGTAILFTPSSDFDGCISALEVVQYNTDYLFHILTSDGDFVVDITGSFILDEDVLTLEGLQLQSVLDDYGCYKICMVDGCYGDLAQFDANLIENGDFSAGGTNWASVDTVFAGGGATISSEGYIEQNTKNTSDAGCLRIQFDWTNEGGSGNINVFVNGVSQFTAILGAGGGSVDFTTYVVPNAGAAIRIYAEPNLASVTIDNVVVSVPDECRVYSQCSPCIKYAAEFACTKMVEGFCEGNAFNFRFDLNSANIFKLSLRAKCELMHSSYDQEQDDYTFSTGSSGINFGQSTKFQSLVFHPIPEFKHDTIALIKVCDTVQIDTVDYFVKKGDYTPEWNKTTNADLAPSRIDVKVKDQTLFNTNCG